MIECPECGSIVRGRKCACGYDIKESHQSKPRYTGCAAHGCPLPGSISRSIHASENADWFCRFHFGEDPEKWMAITTKIRSGEMLRREKAGADQHRKDLHMRFGIKGEDD